MMGGWLGDVNVFGFCCGWFTEIIMAEWVAIRHSRIVFKEGRRSAIRQNNRTFYGALQDQNVRSFLMM